MTDSGVRFRGENGYRERGLRMAVNEMRSKKKTASETVKLNSSEEEQAYVTDVSDAESGAKILKNIDILAKNYEERSNHPRNLLNDIANALGTKGKGLSSKYATFETKNGQIVTIRLGNHTVTVSLFRNRVRKSWVLTVYTIDNNTDAKGRGSDLSSATQNDPIRTRAELGAVLKSDAKVRQIFGLAEKIAGHQQRRVLPNDETKSVEGNICRLSALCNRNKQQPIRRGTEDEQCRGG